MRVVIGSDHGGFSLKKRVVEWLRDWGYEILDIGTYSSDPVDYPDIALLVARTVSQGEPGKQVGIIIDGAGTGSAITANKVPGIRAAACYDVFTARNSREHNDANVLTLGARVTGVGVAKEIVSIWLKSCLSGNRHARRVEKIRLIEHRYMRDEA